MSGSRWAGVWPSSLTVLCLGVLALHAGRATAETCPGHPDALGTSRTLVVDPREHPRIGTMQYRETLPLRDHEVVLTFDDGPLPKNSSQVLQILADQCVKATFFIIGQQARANPDGVRKYVAEGHTIGTHTQNHPLAFQRMPADRIKQEIDQGIESTKATLSDPAALAPFFRMPGLNRSDAAEDHLASLGIQVWSADFLADDWRRIPASRVYELAIKRLEAKGKGILLLHDIQARTVAALPWILHELKARGYRIVHVVPATPAQPATPAGPEQWQLHPPSENVAISHWPRIPTFIYAHPEADAAPAPPDFGTLDASLPLSAEPIARARRHGVPPPEPASWPYPAASSTQDSVVSLPVPAATVFSIPETARATLQPFPFLRRHADDQPATTAEVKGDATPVPAPRRQVRGRFAHGRHLPQRRVHAEAGGRPTVRIATLRRR
ncbi:MAG: polysaccharide deacetylase family protein [Bradyrhizobium sp.]|uniref:polysaccharide deacetylase family protein n=1 Tax=Bradyrhizobium sp. TaxID=376 RepID=UPI001D60C6E1|nr:polysaccharide deacetylase family protein [Bradyrhizobium sp.]MBV9561914.1 polysaccharide deacetylase family protein [Bradyrhizobium sp.]